MAESGGVKVTNQEFMKCYDQLNLSRINIAKRNNSLPWEQVIEILSIFDINVKPKPTDSKEQMSTYEKEKKKLMVKVQRLVEKRRFEMKKSPDYILPGFLLDSSDFKELFAANETEDILESDNDSIYSDTDISDIESDSEDLETNSSKPKMGRPSKPMEELDDQMFKKRTNDIFQSILDFLDEPENKNMELPLFISKLARRACMDSNSRHYNNSHGQMFT